MKRPGYREILKFALPLALLLMLVVTQKFSNHDPDGGPDLYGFPDAFITDTWVNTFEHEIYLRGLITDGFLYLALSLLLFMMLIEPLKNNKLKNGISVLLWLLALAVLGPFILFHSYLRYEWAYGYTMNFMVKSFHLAPLSW
jgi:hypothetical protein